MSDRAVSYSSFSFSSSDEEEDDITFPRRLEWTYAFFVGPKGDEKSEKEFSNRCFWFEEDCEREVLERCQTTSSWMQEVLDGENEEENESRRNFSIKELKEKFQHRFVIYPVFMYDMLDQYDIVKSCAKFVLLTFLKDDLCPQQPVCTNYHGFLVKPVELQTVKEKMLATIRCSFRSKWWNHSGVRDLVTRLMIEADRHKKFLSLSAVQLTEAYWNLNPSASVQMELLTSLEREPLEKIESEEMFKNFASCKTKLLTQMYRP